MINIRDTLTGTIKSSIETKYRVYGRIKLSPDGQTIAARSIDPFDGDNEYVTWFTIYKRNGELSARFKSDEALMRGYDWLPDNRIVVIFKLVCGGYALGVEKTRHELRFQLVSKLESIVGGPDVLSVSPDGKTALFEGVTGNNQFLSGVKYRDSTVYKIDIDGTEGTTTTVTGVSAIPVSSNSLTYAISMDQGSKVLPPQVYSDAVRPIFTIRDGQLSGKFFNPLTDLSWTPSVK